MFHVKHCGGKKENLSAGTERFHVKHFGNSAKNDGFCREARVERGAVLITGGLAAESEKQVGDVKRKRKKEYGRALQTYAVKSNEGK